MRFVRHSHEHAVHIGIAVNGHCFDSNLSAGSDDATGDLAAVCNQDLGEWPREIGLHPQSA